MKLIFGPVVLCLALMVLGCGGGGSNGTSSSGGVAQNFGPFQTRAAGGSPQVQTISNGGPTLTGVAGSAFTYITYAPPAVLANQRIAYERFAGTSSINIVNQDGSGLRQIPGAFPQNALSWSRDGRIAFDMKDPTTNINEIFVVNADGTGLHRITSAGYPDIRPNWSSDNFHIVFSRQDATGHYQIYSCTSSGGSVTNLSGGSGVDDTNPVWSPDGTQIFFLRQNGGNEDAWKMNANGSSPSLVMSGVFTEVALSPTGNLLMLNDWNSGNARLLAFAYPSLATLGVVASDASTLYDFSSFSPDGSKILFTKNTPGLCELDMSNADGTNRSSVAFFNDQSVGRGYFEPFPNPVPYIAATGGYIFGTASSGFIFGMNGNTLTSFVTFTATTPATATLTVDPTVVGASNIVYRASADAITTLKFVNGLGGVVNSTTIRTGVKQALISFNAAMGTVAAVLPVASKQASPVASKMGNQLAYSGRFDAVYDSSGKNIAPAGATQVVLDKNGAVVSVK